MALDSNEHISTDGPIASLTSDIQNTVATPYTVGSVSYKESPN
jgi:hypothetical protein